jgi:hypothetical protein
MSSQPTPSLYINPRSSTPTLPEIDPTSAQSLNAPSPQVSGYLESSALQRAPQYTFLGNLPVTEVQSKQDGSYFSPETSSRSSRMPTFRAVQSTSPLDHLSTQFCISPGLSSSGSYNSSDNALSLCSHSSSELLSPPQFQADCDNPPYIPRHDDLESLSMLESQGAHTMASGKRHRGEKRYTSKQKYRMKKIKLLEHQDPSYWWLPTGRQEMCTGHPGEYIPKRELHTKIATNGSVHSPIGLSPSPPVTRRWSSVEIGTHRMPLVSKPSLKSHNKYTGENGASRDPLAPIDLGQRFKFPPVTRGTAELDIIRTVRERLTLREVGPSSLEVPASITLRRASISSRGSFVDEISPSSRSPIDETGESHRSQKVAGFHSRRASTTYLITSEDIDNITELIEFNINRGYGNNTTSRPSHSETELLSNRVSRATSLKKGFLPSSVSPTEPVITITDQSTYKCCASTLGSLQVLPDQRINNKGSQRSNSIHSSKSSHEVIWQGNTNTSTCGENSEDDLKSSWSFICSAPGTSTRGLNQQAGDISDLGGRRMDKAAYFDLDKGSSVSPKWDKDVSLVITSSDDEVRKERSLEVGHVVRVPKSSLQLPTRERPKVKPFPRYRASATQIRDVESFPALPRTKTTADWILPLPEMETSSSSVDVRSFYGHGSSSNEVTPKASQMSWAKSPRLSPTKNVEFNWVANTSTKVSEPQCTSERRHESSDTQREEPRRKSTVKVHPSAPARTGSPSSIGSSIGVSNHERRLFKSQTSPLQVKSLSPQVCFSTTHQVSSINKISAPHISHVRTIDNIHKGERSDPCSRWRPPSVCPPPRTPSPSEYEDALEERSISPELASTTFPSTGLSNIQRLKNLFTERVGLSRDTSSSSVKINQRGTYEQITGARRRVFSEDQDISQGRGNEVHQCDDAANHPDRAPSVDWIG